MGSYGVIKEALLLKKNGQTNEYTVVQKLVPATVNGMVYYNGNGGFELNGNAISVYSIYHGGASGFSEGPGDSIYHGGASGFSEGPGDGITLKVNIPGYGVKTFNGKAKVMNVSGVGQGVLCTPYDSDPTEPYTHLCLVVESPGRVFDESLG